MWSDDATSSRSERFGQADHHQQANIPTAGFFLNASQKLEPMEVLLGPDEERQASVRDVESSRCDE